MKLKNTLVISLFTLIILAAFASPAACWTGQKVTIPYTSINSAAGYWTGIAIHNPTDSQVTFRITVYNMDGDSSASKICIEVPAGGTEVDLLGNFFSSKIPSRVSIVINTMHAVSDEVMVTMFMGNKGDTNKGFAFQTYYSKDFEGAGTFTCLVIPPFI